MKRMRVSIAGLMGIVLVVAVDLGVFRLLQKFPQWMLIDEAGARDMEILAWGVVPMASLLILLGLVSAFALIRQGKVKGYSIGFQAFGWFSVLAFIAWAVLWPMGVMMYAQLVYMGIVLTWCDPQNGSMSELASNVVLGANDLVTLFVPELLFAMVGGWVARSLRVSLVTNSTNPTRTIQEPALAPIS